MTTTTTTMTLKYVSNRQASRLRRGTVAIKHLADIAPNTVMCGARLAEVWTITGYDAQYLECGRCRRALRKRQPIAAINADMLTGRTVERDVEVYTQEVRDAFPASGVRTIPARVPLKVDTTRASTPTTTTDAVIHTLRRATYDLSFVAFCDALGLTADTYARDKFAEFQQIGRMLGHFDNRTLIMLLEADNTHTRRA